MSDELDDPSARYLERKLATILSADVAKFSRLRGEDEEQTLKTFRGHKQVFESLVAMHRGRIFNTAGDAILAEFGSAVEAVRCATDIQAALRTRNDQLPPSRQVRFRIGINLGDVMVQGQDLLGDGVNVAARLQTAAAPGGICLSGSVHDQIRNKLSLTFQSLGEMNFKNIQQPVRTFSIADAEGHGALHVPKPHGAARLVAATLVVAFSAGAIWWAMRKTAPHPQHTQSPPAASIADSKSAADRSSDQDAVAKTAIKSAKAPDAERGVRNQKTTSSPSVQKSTGQAAAPKLLTASASNNVNPPTQRQEITLDPKIFDRYAGIYQFSPNTLLTISREGERFYAQLAGQAKFQVYPESDRKFFLKAVDAQLIFDVESSGATGVTLHQNGRDSFAKRLSESQAKQAIDDIEARKADVAKRSKDQSPSPGTEAAVRRAIHELQLGEPNYDLMTPQLGALMRQQLPHLQTTMAQNGALQSVTFKGVEPDGTDIYEVKFEHVNTEWRIMVNPDGKTQSLALRPK